MWTFAGFVDLHRRVDTSSQGLTLWHRQGRGCFGDQCAGPPSDAAGAGEGRGVLVCNLD